MSGKKVNAGKLLSMLLIILMILPLVPVTVLAEADVNGDSGASSDLAETVAGVVYYYKENKNNLNSWWEIAALWGAGEDLHSDTWSLPQWSSSSLPVDSPVTDYAGFILGLLARGENPYDIWGGRNLPEELRGRQEETTGSFGAINSHIWAVIALDTAGAAYDEEKALEYILNQQKEDGGFAWGGESGDPDITGMALTVLAGHRDKDNVEEAITAAVNYLKSAQLDTAGFASWGTDNCNSLAAVISGLTAAGADALSDEWNKEGITVLDSLLRFQVEDKSFSFSLNQKTSDSLATRDALIALGDLLAGESVWTRLGRDSENEFPVGPVTRTVNIRVEGIKDTIIDSVVEVVSEGEPPTALDGLKKALDDAEISYEIDTLKWGAYIVSINNEDAATFGGWDGWIFLVNGEMASVGAGDYQVEEGDELVFYYGMYPPDTLVPEVTVFPLNPEVGQEMSVKVSSSYIDWSSGNTVEVNVKGASVLFNGSTYLTDETGEAVIPGSDVSLAGTYYIKVSKDVEGSYPALVRTGNLPITFKSPSSNGGGGVSPGTVTVTVKVVGKATTYFSGEVTLFSNQANVFEALKKTGLSYKARDGYVYEIAGEKEDPESTAGWKYKINGIIPNKAAENYAVGEGDSIIWWYAQDYLSTGPGGTSSPKETGKKEEVLVTKDSMKLTEILSKTTAYYADNKRVLDSWWELVALWGAGEDLNDGTWKLPEWKSGDLPAGSSAVSYAGYILGALSRGEDPVKMWGERNLLLELQEIQRENGGFGGTVNNTIWAIIALDAAGGEYHEEKALEYLLSRQKKDGGFALGGESGDPDVTGMALVALAGFGDRDNAKEGITKAIDFLKEVQLGTGGFASFGAENSNSTAAVISGLTAAGENIFSNRWIKGDNTMVDALLRFRVKDGSFSYLSDPKKADNMATYQSLIALGDILAGESVWLRLKDIRLTSSSGKETDLDLKHFIDVPETHWAFHEIGILAAEGIIQGVGCNKYEADREITRAEFTALLVKALGLPVVQADEIIFDDVNSETWYAGSIHAAYDAGIVQGVGENLFSPQSKITREQMAAMLSQAVDNVIIQEELSFKDLKDISPWALRAVEKTVSRGIMGGFPDGRFRPKAAANRAESAAVIYRMLYN